MARAIVLFGRDRVEVCGLTAEILALLVVDQKILNSLGPEARGSWSTHFSPEEMAAHLLQHTRRIRRAGRLRLAADDGPDVSSVASA